MKILVNSVHFKTDKKLDTFIKEKVEKLEIMYDGIIGCEVSLKLLNTEKPDNKISEIKLLIPGNDLFTSKQSLTFEESIDLSVDALKKQILKHKEKIRKK